MQRESTAAPVAPSACAPLYQHFNINLSSSALEICPQPARPDDIACREFVPLKGPRRREVDENAQIQLYTLCDKCKELGEQLQEWWNTSRETRTIKHHSGLDLLRDSSKRGCHLCTILVGALRDELLQSLIDYTMEVSCHGAIWATTSRGSCNMTSIYPSKEVNHGLLTTSVSMLTTKSATSRLFYLKCREICNSTHTKCSVNKVGRLPTRLLHIIPNSDDTDNIPCVSLFQPEIKGLNSRSILSMLL